MRPVMYFVSRVGDHWEIRCRSDPRAGDFADRAEAIAAARQAAGALWKAQQVASEVFVDDEDGRWHKVATYGDLLGPLG
ncbi:MAG TPA: DUF2188 domain-containing protein [Xanthomonadaceae bacterium]|nr:DUF2188 domain-containing protein [Xanthomonadaceae bacterium]